jgi:hypothetical protein
MAKGEMAALEQAIADYLSKPKKKRPTLETEIRKGMQDILRGLKRIDKKLSSIDYALRTQKKWDLKQSNNG